MKCDNNHLARDFIKKICYHQCRVQRHPGHNILSTELTTQVQCSSWAYTLICTELITPVWYSSRVWVKEQTFQVVSNWIVDTSKHYKLSNKHVTEVSKNMWTRLIKLEWLEYFACLSRTHSSEEVSNHKRQSRSSPKTRKIERKVILWTGGISWQSPSDLAVQQAHCQSNKIQL
jgi:hypothetical protein